jgi:hypothetical protein
LSNKTKNHPTHVLSSAYCATILYGPLSGTRDSTCDHTIWTSQDSFSLLRCSQLCQDTSDGCYFFFVDDLGICTHYSACNDYRTPSTDGDTYTFENCRNQLYIYIQIQLYKRLDMTQLMAQLL